MSSITVYVLKDDNSLTRTGNVENVLYAVEVENLEFTLQPPPSYDRPCYWYDGQWNNEPRN